MLREAERPSCDLRVECVSGGMYGVRVSVDDECLHSELLVFCVVFILIVRGC